MKKKLFYVFAVLVLISIGVYYQNSEEILATSPLSINPVGICIAANTILCEKGCRGSSGLTPLLDDPIQSFPSKCSPYRQAPYSIETCINCCLGKLCADLDAPEMDTPAIHGFERILFPWDSKRKYPADVSNCLLGCPTDLDLCSELKVNGKTGSIERFDWVFDEIDFPTRNFLRESEYSQNIRDKKLTKLWNEHGEDALKLGFSLVVLGATFPDCVEDAIAFGREVDALYNEGIPIGGGTYFPNGNKFIAPLGGNVNLEVKEGSIGVYARWNF